MDLSVIDMVKILDCYDNLTQMSQSCAAVQLKVSQLIQCKIFKNRGFDFFFFK